MTSGSRPTAEISMGKHKGIEGRIVQVIDGPFIGFGAK
jgi:hypothetical protein